MFIEAESILNFRFDNIPLLLKQPLQTETMIGIINYCKKEVDSNLNKAADWSGDFRRHIVGKGTIEEYERAEKAFNLIVEKANNNCLDNLTIEILRSLHNVSAGGFEFRKNNTRVGRNETFPHAKYIDNFIEQLLQDASISQEDTVIKAFKSKIRFVSIHPFADGNGRTSRLICSYFLLQAGFRSTLFTATDQHFRNNMNLYLSSISAFQFRKKGIEETTSIHLMAMINNVLHLCWFRKREEKMIEVLKTISTSESDLNNNIIDYDFGKPTKETALLLNTHGFKPLHHILNTCSPLEKEALNFQLKRIKQEEFSLQYISL